jgi:hypothetical protein
LVGVGVVSSVVSIAETVDSAVTVSVVGELIGAASDVTLGMVADVSGVFGVVAGVVAVWLVGDGVSAVGDGPDVCSGSG